MYIGSLSEDKFRVSIKAIIWFILLGCFLISAPLLSAWSWWLLLGMVASGFLLAVPLFLLRRIWNKKRPSYTASGLYVRSALACSIVLVFLAALPVYYFAYQVSSSPMSVPKVSMTNGKKTIVFQGMMHIGAETFYKSIAYDVERAIADGYHVHFEGIKESPGEGDQFLANYLGGGNAINDNYKAISDICGLKFQKDYFGIMEEHAKKNPSQVRETDVSSLDLKTEYNRLVQTDPEFAAAEGPQAQKTKTADKEGEYIAAVLALLHHSTPQQQKLVGIIGRGFINTVMSVAATNSQKNKLILHYRNRFLTNQVLKDEHDRIYILYGVAHIQGVVELLRSVDPGWKIGSISWQRVIAEPEQAKGQIPGLVVGK